MMSAGVLDRLTSEEFALSAGFLSTPSSLRRFLHRTKEVGQINDALRQEAISEDTLRRFISRLVHEFRPGERFPHELAFAALAVAVEMRPTDFADEFLRDLARLKIREMSLAIRVARECLKYRQSVAATTAKTLNLGSGNGADELSAIPFARPLSTSTQTRAHHLCGVT